MERRNLALLCAGVLCFWLCALAFGTAEGRGVAVQAELPTAAPAAVEDVPVVDAAAQPQLSLNCRAAILVDQDTGTVLYEKNADEQVPIASITKVMTLLLAFEAVHDGRLTMETPVPVSEHAYHMGGSQIWLEPGEQFTLDEMPKAICVSSANDAAVAVAELVGGSETAFVQQMNASLSDQLLTLGRTMTEVNQHQQASLEQVRQSLNAAAAIQVDMRQLHDVTNDVIAHFEQYIKELSAARSRDEGFERSSADLLTRLGKVSDQQLSALNRIRAGQEELARVTEQFTRQSSETTAAMKQSSNATTQELSGVADAMKQSAAELSAGCQNFTQSVVSGLSQSLGMFDASMQGLMAMMGETTDKLSGTDSAEATRQAAETQRLLTALKESIDAATAALRQKEG